MDVPVQLKAGLNGAFENNLSTSIYPYRYRTHKQHKLKYITCKQISCANCMALHSLTAKIKFK